MGKRLKSLVLVTVFFFDFFVILAGINDTVRWPNIYSSIVSGAEQFLEKESNHYSKQTVFVIKIICLEKNKGEFSISYIWNDESYNRTNASHYLIIDNRLFLIRTDKLGNTLTEKTNIPIITDKIKQMAYETLAGPNVLVTSQSPDIMVFQYNKKDLTGKLYTPLVPREKKYYFDNDER